MRIKNKKQRKGTSSMVALAVASVMAVGSIGYPLAANASQDSNRSARVSSVSADERYKAFIKPLNDSDVIGQATFEVIGNTLKVTVHAEGLEPGVHPQHIHGHEEMRAECPTAEADVDGDGFLSVIEGAPAYGPIKLNLTNPQTDFGTPPTTALFTEFAGTPDNADFPVVTEDGVLDFTNTYTFDSSEAAQAAKASLSPLGDQHIVIHGATAPKFVDAPAFAALGTPFAAGTDLTERFYDPLLPVGCGEIDAVGGSDTPKNNDGVVVNPGVQKLAGLNAIQAQLTQSLNQTGMADFNTRVGNLSVTFTDAVGVAVAAYNAAIDEGMNKDEARNQLINAVSSAKDAELNGLTEARNQQIDMLNRSGDVAKRDAFLQNFETTVHDYRHVLEGIKNQL